MGAASRLNMDVFDRCRHTYTVSEHYAGVVSVGKRGLITLPAELRRRLHLDEEGTRLEIVERDDGVIELRPAVAPSADQEWFWSDRWQAMEREADSDVKTGWVDQAKTVEEFFEILDNQD